MRFRAAGSVRLALTGAALPVVVGGRAAGWGTALSVPAGSVVEVGRSGEGLRGWLAVTGGIDVAPTLGSRSTDTLSGLGPPPVAAGDVLEVGRLEVATDAPPAEAVPPARPPRPAVLGLRLGPRDDWFDADSVQRLLTGRYEVSAASSRVAVRLRGPALARRIPGELASEGITLGAVQVPGDGQPLVFLADHPTTGGYPVVGVLDDAALSVCAQLRPGDEVRFIRAR
jgi:biotin-dependent carboxylase-like uncharacterized protein